MGAMLIALWPSRSGRGAVQAGLLQVWGVVELWKAGRFSWACRGGRACPKVGSSSTGKVSWGHRVPALPLPLLPSQGSGTSSCHLPPHSHCGLCTLTYHMPHSPGFSPVIGYSLEQPCCGGPGYLLLLPGGPGWAWAPEGTQWSQ